MMGLVAASVCDSAWVRVRRLTAGPVIAANTQAHDEQREHGQAASGARRLPHARSLSTPGQMSGQAGEAMS